MSKVNLQRLGETVFQSSDRVSAELLALTYGSTVKQLLVDYEEPDEVNKQLDQMGYNIGIRLIEDVIANSKIYTISSFVESAEIVAKVAFKMYLGVVANTIDWNTDKTEFSLQFDENPLTEFTELPDRYSDLWYANVLCGIIRGAYEMVQMKVECKYTKCVLRGDDTNEIRIELREMLLERPPLDDE
mmetsp:Transcript_15825/g.64686  ORF Transcript_15825/g.64686 Transcript_15825/m.64686 type:complete len:187 (-) Transcript_15825:3436-3996(-)